jgi:signal transduction histidine kinase
MKFFKITPLTLVFHHIVVVSIFGVSLLIILQIITFNTEKNKEIINLNNKILFFQEVETERELIELILKSIDTYYQVTPKQIYSYTNKKGEVFGNAKIIEGASGVNISFIKEISNKQKKSHTKLLAQNKAISLTDVFKKNITNNEYFLIQRISLFGGELILGKDIQRLRLLFSLMINIAVGSILPTIIFALIAGKILTNKSSKKIYEINETLSSLAKGDLNARVTYINNYSVDIFSIVKNINLMATAHKKTIETLNQISSDIAHDLKSPIQRVQLSIAEIQNFKSVPNKIDIKLNSIHNEIDDIMKIFNSILEISQMEVSSLKPDFKRINLTHIINIFFELYEPFVEQSDHKLIADFDKHNDLFVMGNEELIGRLIVNLIENSVYHTPKGVKIKIKLKQYNKCLRLIIADNGIGIPAQYHEKVLNRFYKMEISRTSDGSGLGLSLVNAIAKLHNAKLTLKNNDPGLIVMLDFVLV